MTDREGPIYTRYFSQFVMIMWSKEELFLKDIFKRQHLRWKMKDLLSCGEELKIADDTLKEVESGKETQTEVILGEDVRVSVASPVPLVTFTGKSGSMKMDAYAWWLFLDGCEELRQKFGSDVERTQLMEDFMKVIYTNALTDAIKVLITEKCHGCQIDHPSQLQHDVCLMMDVDEQVRTCMPEAMDKLDQLQVTRLWELSIGLIEPRPSWEEYSKWMSVEYRLYWLNSIRDEIEKRVVKELS